MKKFQKFEGDSDNPFKDVNILRLENEDGQTTIKIILLTSEELDIDALEKLVAELIAADLVKHDNIKIATYRDGNSRNIRYEGQVTILDSEK